MKNPAFFLMVVVFVGSAFAQSGRRVEPMPTPAPVSEAPAYSESVPNPNKPMRVFPPRPIEKEKPAAQTTPPVLQTPGTADAKDPLEEGEVERVGTNLITIPVSVFDRHGMYIPNLEQKNFTIFEDGQEQEIAYFGTSEKPFTVILLLDTSPSTEYKIEEIRRAAIAFVDQLKSQDKVSVIEFDGNVHVLCEPTGDRMAIYKAINRADFGGGTSLYDSVRYALTKKLNLIDGRKAVVLFTDGVDTTSTKSNYDTTLAMAEESDALIFPIYYNTFFDTVRNNRGSGLGFPFPGMGYPAPGTTAEEYALGRRYLDELAAYTGGRVFKPESAEGGLTRAFEGIAEELRRQYNIGYVPVKDGTPGQRKQIKVRVDRPNLVIRARDSYIVGRTKK
jgi:VWFA-related protein